VLSKDLEVVETGDGGPFINLVIVGDDDELV
jgi:hypothetical protein